METIRKPAYSINEELANFLSHGLGIILSVLGLIVLLIKGFSNESPLEIISYSIFGLSLIALYSASTAYHMAKTEKNKIFLKKIDHICIYYLIAGSYTPFLLLNLTGSIGIVFFLIVWIMAILGTFYKLRDKKGNIVLSVGIYLVMGWLVVFVREPMMASLPEESLKLLLTGGIFYTLGVPFYLMKKVPYHHALWHLMVLGGSISHYFAIKWTVL